MRRRVVTLGAVVAVLSLIAALGWPRSREIAASSEPLPTPPRIDIVAHDQSGLTLEGRVVDARGQGVAGVEVALSSSAQRSLGSIACRFCGKGLADCPTHAAASQELALLQQPELFEPSARTQTDSAGAFRFEHLIGAAFTVYASNPGGSAELNRVAPGQPVLLRLMPSRSFRGRLVDESGQAVTGANIYVVSPGLAPPVRATSDATGAFEGRAVGDGPFELIAAKDGFLPEHAQRVEVAGPPTVLTLRRPRALVVTLTRDGKAASGRVRLRADHLERSGEATALGPARFEHLDSDSIQALASSGSLSAGPREIQLVDRETQASLELEPGGTLAVTLLEHSGGPVGKTTVGLLPLEDRGAGLDDALWQEAVGPGEPAILGPIPVGTYRLDVSGDGYLDREVPVRLTDGQSRVEVTLERAITVSGRVLDENGRPVPNLLIGAAPSHDTAVSDPEGHFLLTVPTAGLYTLEAHHSEWGGALLPVQAPATQVELRLEAKSGVEVELQSDEGPLEGGRAFAWTHNRAQAFETDVASGADGELALRGLPPGHYWISATHPRFLDPEPVELDLAEGAFSHRTFHLRAGKFVSGQVVDEQGAALCDASVISLVSGHLSAATDGAGYFSLGPFAATESVRVQASRDGYSESTSEPMIPGGGPARLVLKRNSSVRGRVVSSAGGAIRHFSIDGTSFDAADGRFSVEESPDDNPLTLLVAAPGFHSRTLELAPVDDVGDVELTLLDTVHGQVVDAQGNAVDGALVTCTTCDTSSLSSARGDFELSLPEELGEALINELYLTAKKDDQSGSARLDPLGQTAVRIQIASKVQVTGRLYASDGSPAAGRELPVFDVDRSDLVDVVTGSDGSYSVELAPGRYRFPDSADSTSAPPFFIVTVNGPMHLDLGPAPGSGSLLVEAPSNASRTIWVVPGETFDPAHLEDMAFGAAIFDASGNTRIDGLPRGPYMVIVSGGPFADRDSQPIVRRVEVSSVQAVSVVSP